MSSVCRLLIFVVAMIISIAIAQTIYWLPSGAIILLCISVLAYLVGEIEKRLILKVVSTSIILGILKCWLGY